MTTAELERLTREQRPRLLAAARRRARTRADAEDAVQEALVIAFTNRERIRPQSAIAYIAVIAPARGEPLRPVLGATNVARPSAGGADYPRMSSSPTAGSRTATH